MSGRDRESDADSRMREARPEAAAVAAHDRARRALRSASELRALVRQLESERDLAQRQLESALGGVEALEQRLAPLTAPARGGALPAATMVATLSDTHPGERVRRAEVGGVNEYTPAIFEARMEQFWRALRTMLNVNRAGWSIDTLLLWLGGDLMTGWIHEEYIAENYLSPTEELEASLHALVRGLRFLLDECDLARIRVVTSNGNHGRTTDRMWSAGAYRTSYEHLLYRLLAWHFRDESRLEWQLATGYENQTSVYGYRITFHHGNEVRYAGGVGGIAMPLYRRLHRVNSGPLAAQLHVCGHHHSLGYFPGAFVNGSLIGATPFAIGRGFAPEPPQQLSWVIDAKHQVPSAMTPLLCSEQRARGRK